MYSSEFILEEIENKIEEINKQDTIKTMTFTLNGLWKDCEYGVNLIPQRCEEIRSTGAEDGTIEAKILNSYSRLLAIMEERIASLGLREKLNSGMSFKTLQAIHGWTEKMEISGEVTWNDILKADVK